MDALAKKVFTDQAEMLDPNFKDPLKGREAIVKHFSKLLMYVCRKLTGLLLSMCRCFAQRFQP